jgi:hypothetical protein
MPTKLTTEILAAAVLGFEEQKRQIDLAIAGIRTMLGGGSEPTAATPEPPKRKRRKMSAAGRKAIAEAQRKRWADSKRQSEPSLAAAVAPKPKRKLSPAGRAAIIAATKRRWALKRAEAEKAAPKKIARKKAAARKTAAKKPRHAVAKASAPIAAPGAAAQ